MTFRATTIKFKRKVEIRLNAGGFYFTDLMKAGHMGTAFAYVALSVLVGVAVIFFVEYMTLK